MFKYFHLHTAFAEDSELYLVQQFDTVRGNNLNSLDSSLEYRTSIFRLRINEMDRFGDRVSSWRGYPR